jgi:serine/threonine-protein kinase
MALAAGDVLDGRYVLLQPLGAGGFGSVWAAMDTRTTREVAVKVLRATVGDHGGGQQRFLDEALILGRLEHPSIVRPLDRFVDGERACIVTELVAGTTLRAHSLARLESGRALRLDEVEALIEHIAHGLAHAHARGVVHRDLKPQNVMVTGAPPPLSVRVLDFGLARVTRSGGADATTLGRVVGTCLYMAPEQFETPKVGPGVDQFALASLAFALLTLRWAWARDESAPERPRQISDELPASATNAYGAVLYRISHGPRPSVRGFRPELPAELDDILARAWRRDPAERFPSISEFSAALRRTIGAALDEASEMEPTAMDTTGMEPTASDTAGMEPGMEPTAVDTTWIPREPRPKHLAPEPAQVAAPLVAPATAVTEPTPSPEQVLRDSVWFGPILGLASMIVVMLLGLLWSLLR